MHAIKSLFRQPHMRIVMNYSNCGSVSLSFINCPDEGLRGADFPVHVLLAFYRFCLIYTLYSTVS